MCIAENILVYVNRGYVLSRKCRVYSCFTAIMFNHILFYHELRLLSRESVHSWITFSICILCVIGFDNVVTLYYMFTLVLKYGFIKEYHFENHHFYNNDGCQWMYHIRSITMMVVNESITSVISQWWMSMKVSHPFYHNDGCQWKYHIRYLR